ncbi:hypothetical protein KUF71_005200 [Frankliniella fusca]|uniref:Peptidase A2 domain-containing protein n=1 Tax=Frankliniella fusca TaxID=407009 RepID=A0AAE1I1K7_9NEOP|nr:hypothetical protein KUF71_005200 [Frankliniella fusca]
MDPSLLVKGALFLILVLLMLGVWIKLKLSKLTKVHVISIGSVKTSPPLLLTLVIESLSIQFEVDTGAGVTVMPIKSFKTLFPDLQLKPSVVQLSALSGEITNTGQILVNVKFRNVLHKLTMITCDHNSDFNPLLGRDWLDVILPQWRSIVNSPIQLNPVSSIVDPPSLDELKKLFPRPFNSEADTVIEGFTAKLVLKSNACPIFARAYPLPYGLEEPVSKVLDKMEADGKAVRVRLAEWASPALAVPKKDGGIRYVADFKRTINPQLRVDFYPLPAPEQVFATLANGNFFTSLDLTDAYTQLQLDADSQELCVINTHKGLYKLTRLIYGVSSAAAIFQSTMDKILNGIAGVICYLDNILIKAFIPKFKPGDRVYVKFPHQPTLDGFIVAPSGVSRFQVNIEGVIKDIHANNLAKIP